jgi:hypothetical protein
MKKLRLSILAAIFVYFAITLSPVQAVPNQAVGDTMSACIPDGSPDDLLGKFDCCSGVAVPNTVTCDGSYPENCWHTCGSAS